MYVAEIRDHREVVIARWLFRENPGPLHLRVLYVEPTPGSESEEETDGKDDDRA